jgi:hypothetical protein
MQISILHITSGYDTWDLSIDRDSCPDPNTADRGSCPDPNTADRGSCPDSNTADGDPCPDRNTVDRSSFPDTQVPSVIARSYVQYATILVVIGTDCIDSCKSSYLTITTTTAP